MASLVKRSNGIYYAVFFINGKRVWRSSGVKDKKQAREFVATICDQYVSRRNLSVLDLRSTLAELLEGTLRPATIALYNQTLASFAEEVGDLHLKNLQPYHIDLFRARRMKKVSAVKVSIDFRTLRAALNQAAKFKMIKTNPAIGCRGVNIPEKEPRFFLKDEFEKLMAVIDDHNLRCIVLLAVSTGMRSSEILNLKWENCDRVNGFIHLKNTDDFTIKGRRRRSIPLNQTARTALDAMLNVSEFVFPEELQLKHPVSTISKRFRKCVRRARLPREIHFHTLRHTAATWLIQQGVPVPYVQKILGHSNISTTMIYSHQADEHLRHAVQKIDSILLN